MLRRIRPLLALALIPALPAHARPLDADGQPLPTRTLPARTSAERAPAGAMTDLAALAPLAKSFASERRCSALFADTPAKEIAGHASAKLFRDPANWHPFCTAFAVERERLERKGTLAEAIAAAEAWTIERDVCSNKKSQDRYSGEYRPPSQNELNLRPMTTQERERLKQAAADVRREVGDQCCAGNAECLEAFGRVEIRLCEPQADPSAPEPCMAHVSYSKGDFTAFAATIRELQPLAPAARGEAVRGKFAIVTGFVRLAPLVSRGGDARLLEQLANASHEFGHACSRIRRSQLVRQADPSAVSELMSEFTARGCEIDADARAVYERLLGERKLGPEAARCLFDRSLQARDGRFTPIPCEKGCPRQVLEEYLAQLFAMDSLIAEHAIPEIFPGFCYLKKDANHGLGADYLQCLLRDPQLEPRLVRASGCRR